jgi:hypothetical protein
LEKEMGVKKYVICLSDTAVSRMAELAARLQQAGFQVNLQLDATGVITGAADEAIVPRIRSMDGVRSIEEEQVFQLPPAGSDPA